ncbi:MAG: hypothetical protein DRI94_06190 [Bacteroidetes bacterium]|nr:MAG: hypothetical protein DRI94_06190 [Bacteroidota bacterium]
MKKTAFTLSIVLQFILMNGQVQTVFKNDITTKNYNSLKSIETKFGNFVYTYSDNIFTDTNIDFLKDSEISYIRIDSIVMDLSDVKFIKSNNDFWANTNKINNKGDNIFAIRIYTGNANLFTRVELSEKKWYNNISITTNQLYEDYTSNIEKNSLNYYNIELGELKRLTYKNLDNDLSDNPKSLSLLNKSRIYQKRSILLYIAGITSVIYGFGSGLNQSDKFESGSNHTWVSFYLPVSIGLGSFWLGSRMSKKKSLLIQNAVKSY